MLCVPLAEVQCHGGVAVRGVLAECGVSRVNRRGQGGQGSQVGHGRRGQAPIYTRTIYPNLYLRSTHHNRNLRTRHTPSKGEARLTL